MTIRVGIVADMRRTTDDGKTMLGDVLYDKVNADVMSVDSGIVGCTTNHIRTWTKLLQHGGDWLVVLEDDAIPVEGFRDYLAMALHDPPTDIVSLYLGQGYPTAWQRFIKKAVASKEATYILSTHVLHGLALAIKTDLVNDMLRMVAWMSQEQRQWPIDEQITHWARERGHAIAYTKPSLVDHADGETLVEPGHHGIIRDGQGTNGIKRVAWEVGTSARWDKTKVVSMP